MKEINEKDLEKAAGGRKTVDGYIVHYSFEGCELFERRDDPSLPDDSYQHCYLCAHAEKLDPYGETLKCLLGK